MQGTDGKLLQLNLLTTSKPPNFDYDRARSGLDSRRAYGSGQGAVFALQRMEPPVIYFYSDQELAADVVVRFPKGLLQNGNLMPRGWGLHGFKQQQAFARRTT